MGESLSFTVDFVAIGPAPDEWTMVLVEQGPWEEEVTARLTLLQSRVYNSIDAAIDGQLASKFPQSRGKSIIVKIDFYDLDTPRIRHFIDEFSSSLPLLSEYSDAIRDSIFVEGVRIESEFFP